MDPKHKTIKWNDTGRRAGKLSAISAFWKLVFMYFSSCKYHKTSQMRLTQLVHESNITKVNKYLLRFD